MVSYPSEPILALAAKELISELTGDDLFMVLKRKLESISIDRGEIAEVFAGMIFLRAIDNAQPFVRPANDLSSYEERPSLALKLIKFPLLSEVL